MTFFLDYTVPKSVKVTISSDHNVTDVLYWCEQNISQREGAFFGAGWKYGGSGYLLEENRGVLFFEITDEIDRTLFLLRWS